MSLETYALFVLPGMFLAAALIGLGLLQLSVRRLKRANEDRYAILRAVANLQPTGRSYTIAKEAERILGRGVSTARLFVVLRELEDGGRIVSRWDGPQSPYRPRSRFYAIVGVPFAAGADR